MSDPTFSDLGLGPKVEAAVEAAGYINPTPIQAAAIPTALTGRDVLGIAQTGTGKTASFTLPMITLLERGRARARMPRSLILAPTRELAAQVAESFEKYGVNHKLTVALLIGGVSMDEQVRKLDRGVDVLIATPGRLLDHFQRGRIMLMGVEILVIDEADRMLDMGFIPDIEKICKLLPPRRQTLFFSATMPKEIKRLVDQFLDNPERVEVAPPATTAKTIKQTFHFCRNGEDWAKRETLRDLIRTQDVKNAIVFCNRKRDVAILLKSLAKHGFNAGALHGDMDQTSRMATLAAFRGGEIQILAASDVAARGLDIPEVSHVFNFDVPLAADDYVHRIGRTGRAGRDGFAATLVGAEDLKRLSDIERLIGEAPDWGGDAPNEDDIADAKSAKRRGRGRSGGRGERKSDPGSEAKQKASTTEGRSGRRRRATATSNEQPALDAAPTPEIDAPQPAMPDAAPSSVTDRAEPAPERPRRKRGSTAANASSDRGGGSAKPTGPVTPTNTRTAAHPGRTDMSEAERAEATFGGMVPAFLQRPARPPKPKPPKD
ncbi:MAG: DEAD/DEAH box helicase [Pseudomonadota bacterium]